MKVICYNRYGGIDRLQFEEFPSPEPGSQQVLVRVAAAAINPIDWKTREGQVRWVYPLKFPVIPGQDFCGTVHACGEGVSGFKPGERVCGMSNQRGGGALAELCLCGADALAHVPEGMRDEEAAGLPLAGLTALQGLRDHGRMKSGHRVLVVGASGGVGHLAVQIARNYGARVSAVCGPDNVAWVSELGPEKVINYREEGWVRRAGTFDLIFDAVGTLGFRRSLDILKKGGSYVTTLPGLAIFINQLLGGPLLRRRARTFLARPSGADLQELLAAWKKDRLDVRIDRIWNWKDYSQAFARSESGHAKGKIVLAFG
ncbi:MAG: NADP-dependent oxidoreductase [Opitutales bacterium]